MGADINLTLPTLGESNDFFVVAFIDPPNVVPSACSKVTTIGRDKFYSIRRVASSDVVEMLINTCTICFFKFSLVYKILVSTYIAHNAIVFKTWSLGMCLH